MLATSRGLVSMDHFTILDTLDASTTVNTFHNTLEALGELALVHGTIGLRAQDFETVLSFHIYS